MKRFGFLLLVLLIIIAGVFLYQSSMGKSLTASLFSSPSNTMTTVTLHTSAGDITIELLKDNAPAIAKNFQQLAEAGLYDGVIFHRVIKGFMIQGGGF